MLLRSPPDPLHTPAYRTGSLVLFAAVAVILTALAFEHIGGYSPCPLCLQQRYAYYAAIPLLFLALVLVVADRCALAAVLFLAVAAGFLANAGLGVFHAGVEWKFWAGPDTCAATPQSLSTSAGDLLKRLETARVVRCDEAPWRFADLSFAGWNVVTSLLLALGAIAAALEGLRRSS
jgi:disulfide bond formation protein DsbB